MFHALIRTVTVLCRFALACGPRFSRDADLSCLVNADPKRIDKINKKVFNVDGADLQLVCTTMASGVIKCEDNVDMRVQNRFKELTFNHYGTRRSSHVSPPPVEGGTRYSSPADIGTFQSVF